MARHPGTGIAAPQIAKANVLGAIGFAEFRLHQAQHAANLLHVFARFVDRFVAVRFALPAQLQAADSISSPTMRRMPGNRFAGF